MDAIKLEADKEKHKLSPAHAIAPRPVIASVNEPRRSRRSSAEVIKDAKNWCALQAISTKRPSTPLEVKRSLFGGDHSQRLSRPPSTYSLGAHHFDADDPASRPGSGTSLTSIKPKLQPLVYKPVIPVCVETLVGLKSTTTSTQSHHNTPCDTSDSTRAESRLPQPGSPVKAIHGDFSEAKPQAAEIVRQERDVNMALRYHPTPPPKHLRRKKSPADSPISRSEDGSADVEGQNGKTSAKSNSSAGSVNGATGDEETKEQAFYWNQTILPLIEELEDFHTKETDKLCETCISLYDALERNSCFKSISPRRRTSLLSSLFRLLNIPSNDVHLLCARIILQVRVNNKNLTSICKLLFRIARDRSHDILFVKHELIVPMLNLLEKADNPFEKYEAFVYLCGSIKFVTENKELAVVMMSKNCIHILAKFMKTVVKRRIQHAGHKKITKQAADLLVQVTEAFRNMLDADKKLQQSCKHLSVLLHVLDHHDDDEKLTWILSRIFSKITVYNAAIPLILDVEGWQRVIMTSLDKHKKTSNVTVRLAFAVGNILTHSDFARQSVFFFDSSSYDVIRDDDGGDDEVIPPQQQQQQQPFALQVILGTLDHYLHHVDHDSDSCGDVIVKMVRCVANLSICERVGRIIALNSPCVEMLMDVIGTQRFMSHEELITNSLVALNNLAYYDSDSCGDDDVPTAAVCTHRLRLATLLTKLMMSDNMSCITEIARVLGNLTKYRDVRDLVQQHKVNLMMCALLDSGDRHVVYNACGVLINISGDREKRQVLIQENIVHKLADVIKDYSPVEWRIAGVACQLSWNLVSDDKYFRLISSDETDKLIQVLQNLLDESTISNEIEMIAQGDAETREYMTLSWRDHFCAFAHPLLTCLLQQQEKWRAAAVEGSITEHYGGLV